MRGWGCQCKVDGLTLTEILTEAFGDHGLRHPMHNPEDSAYLTDVPSRLLVTCDFAAVIEADLRIAGRIAALHAFSDIYACGGLPRWALATVIIPEKDAESIGAELMKGILDGCMQCQATLVGGQSAFGAEIMAGLGVMGTLIGETPIRKRGAQVGDRLLLSKPVGVGIAVQAFRSTHVGLDVYQRALAVMSSSNEAAARAAVAAGVSSGTDISGFGLLGHLAEMLGPSSGADVFFRRVPSLSNVAELPDGVFHAASVRANWEYASSQIRILSARPIPDLAVLLDAQTNGGLLVAVTPARADELRQTFTDIGCITESGTIIIRDCGD